MKNTTYLCLLLFCLSSTFLSGQNKKMPSLDPKDLSKQINEMWKNQQTLRNQKSEIRLSYGMDSRQMEENLRKTEEVDYKSYQLVKAIIKRNGYPTYKMIGQESAHNFFNMVQHCDHDQDLQYQILREMDIAVANHQASRKDYAYLTDRVLVNQGEKQIYGTQIEYDHDKKVYQAYSVENPTEVNKKRKTMGLPPMENYVSDMNKNYIGTVKKEKTRKRKKPYKSKRF